MLLNRPVPFRFAFLSAFSVPRSEHPRPSDARSPSRNPLCAFKGADSFPQASCGLLPQIPSSRLGSGSRRHTLRASMYRRQRTNQKEKPQDGANGSQTPFGTHLIQKPKCHAAFWRCKILVRQCTAISTSALEGLANPESLTIKGLIASNSSSRPELVALSPLRREPTYANTIGTEESRIHERRFDHCRSRCGDRKVKPGTCSSWEA